MTGFFKLNMYKNETLGNMTARYYYIKTLRNEVDCKEFLDESLDFLRCVCDSLLKIYFNSFYQVSTSTGTISRKVHLSVVRPEAFILGGDEYHIDRGSQISLVCVIEKAPTPPQ